jgi:hypothetical protein
MRYHYITVGTYFSILLGMQPAAGRISTNWHRIRHLKASQRHVKRTVPPSALDVGGHSDISPVLTPSATV